MRLPPACPACEGLLLHGAVSRPGLCRQCARASPSVISRAGFFISKVTKECGTLKCSRRVPDYFFSDPEMALCLNPHGCSATRCSKWMSPTPVGPQGHGLGSGPCLPPPQRGAPSVLAGSSSPIPPVSMLRTRRHALVQLNVSNLCKFLSFWLLNFYLA